MNKSEIKLDLEFREYGKNAKKWTNECKLLLLKIDKQQIWKKKGFKSIQDYALRIAGLSFNAVKTSLWILRKIEDKPLLMEIAKEKSLNALRPIANIATKKNEKFWANKVRELSKHALEKYVQDIRKSEIPSDEKMEKISEMPMIFSNSEILEKLLADEKNSIEKQKNSCPGAIELKINAKIVRELQKFKGRGSWDGLMEEFIQLKKEKIAEERRKLIEAEILKNGNDLFLAKSANIPKKIKKFIIFRCADTCESPECLKAGEIFHHVDRLALTKSHHPDRIRFLCKGHERLAHNGLIKNEDLAPKYWKVKLEAEKSDLKYAIDQKVMDHRNKYQQRE